MKQKDAENVSLRVLPTSSLCSERNLLNETGDLSLRPRIHVDTAKLSSDLSSCAEACVYVPHIYVPCTYIPLLCKCKKKNASCREKRSADTAKVGVSANVDKVVIIVEQIHAIDPAKGHGTVGSVP